MATRGPHVQDDGSLFIRSRLIIPADEIVLRVTTSGGPGGQHANRAMTRVVASFPVASSAALGETDRDLLLDKIGTVVRASSSRFRSQGQNRTAAMTHLAESKPTRAAKERRVDEKKARSRVKEQRRRPSED